MPRIKRVDIGDCIYHVINRSNARAQIFYSDNDYELFMNIVVEAVEKFDMRLLAYCIMPNHWHLVLYPKNDGDLGLFMGWLTNTHTRRWHTINNTVGFGHLYQGRYKSFICQNDYHLQTILRYVERNAKRAKLVERAEDWRWSSVWAREYGQPKQKKILSQWPIQIPSNYLTDLNDLPTLLELDSIHKSIDKNIPFGDNMWVEDMVKRFGIGQALRPVGRPKKMGADPIYIKLW